MRLLNTILYFLLLLLCLSCKSDEVTPDYFSGEIVYRITYFDSVGNEIDAATLGRDTERHYFISDGNYKSLNENGVLVQLYNGSSNKYYFVKDGQLESSSGADIFPEEGDFVPIEWEGSFLNYDCVLIQERTEVYNALHYYAPDLKVNSKLFADHNFGNWNKYLEASDGALPLRLDFSSRTLNSVLEAIEVNELELDDDNFDVNSEKLE